MGSPELGIPVFSIPPLRADAGVPDTAPSFVLTRPDGVAHAPLSVDLSMPALQEELAKLRTLTVDNDHKERGGIFVANPDGTVVLGNPSVDRSGNARSETVALDWTYDQSTQRLVGSVHTHPHGDYPPSGGDLGVLMSNDADFLLVQSPNRQYLVLKSKEAITPQQIDLAMERDHIRAIGYPQLDVAEEHRLTILKAAERLGLDELTSSHIATAIVAREFGLTLYEADNNGKFHRVDPPVLDLGPGKPNITNPGLLSLSDLDALATANMQAYKNQQQFKTQHRFPVESTNGLPGSRGFVSPPPR